MSERSPRYRALTIPRPHKDTQAEDYLRMLDLPSARQDASANDDAGALAGSDMRRPRMLSGSTPRDPLFEANPECEDALPAETLGQPARDWKLSARLDRDLLAEVYGAAAALAVNGATVSSLVEEALRLYLPRLRAQHNDGRAFCPRGPRARASSARKSARRSGWKTLEQAIHDASLDGDGNTRSR